MSNPVSFVNTYVGNIVTLINAVEQLQIQNDMIAQDSTLVTRYFQAANTRTDITAQDIANAESAVTQMAFTFNSGSPTQKSYLFKMMP